MTPVLPIAGGRLRPATMHDLDRVLGLLHDETVRRYLCDEICLPRETVRDMLTRSETLAASGLGFWIIEQRPSGFSGIVGLQPVSTHVMKSPLVKDGIEPLIALQPTYIGRGLASAALRSVMRYAGTSLALDRLVAAVDEPNERSRRLMQRTGFKEVGRLEGPAHELVLYECQLVADPAPSGNNCV